jgi:hypothetical protein
VPELVPWAHILWRIACFQHLADAVFFRLFRSLDTPSWLSLILARLVDDAELRLLPAASIAVPVRPQESAPPDAMVASRSLLLELVHHSARLCNDAGLLPLQQLLRVADVKAAPQLASLVFHTLLRVSAGLVADADPADVADAAASGADPLTHPLLRAVLFHCCAALGGPMAFPSKIAQGMLDDACPPGCWRRATRMLAWALQQVPLPLCLVF